MLWDYNVDCVSTNQLSCEGLPDPNPADETVEPWPEDDPVCSLGAANDICVAPCVAGLTGEGASAFCNGDTGAWEIDFVDCA
jgi:hypothetical protein